MHFGPEAGTPEMQEQFSPPWMAGMPEMQEHFPAGASMAQRRQTK
jgi:hypothetical protein